MLFRIALLGLTSASLFLLPGCDPVQAAEPVPTATPPQEHVITLRATDDILSSWSLSHNEPGLHSLDGVLVNENTQLMYDRYVRGSLVVGIEGEAKGAIVDMGDLRVAGTLHSAFHSLRRDGDVIVFAGLDDEEQPDRRQALPPGTKLAAAKPVAGHLYLVRIDQPHVTDNPTVYAALRVIEIVEGSHVTLRTRIL